MLWVLVEHNMFCYFVWKCKLSWFWPKKNHLKIFSGPLSQIKSNLVRMILGCTIMRIHIDQECHMRIYNTVISLSTPLKKFPLHNYGNYIYIYIYMIDSDRRPYSNRRPPHKSASTDIIISNHGPILGYSQIGPFPNSHLNRPVYTIKVCHQK